MNNVSHNNKRAGPWGEVLNICRLLCYSLTIWALKQRPTHSAGNARCSAPPEGTLRYAFRRLHSFDMLEKNWDEKKHSA